MARSGQVAVLAGKTKTRISISVSPTVGDAPFDVTVLGTLTEQVRSRAVAGRQVNLWVNGVVVESTTTDSSGNYGFIYTIQDVGTWMIETEFPGDAQYAGCIENASAGESVAVPSLLPLVAVAGIAVVGIWYLSRS